MKKTGIALLLLAGLAGVAWWQREPALAWYFVRQLTRASEEDREDCATRVASLDGAALPRLLEGLQNGDASACANLQYALVLMAKRWGPTDPRSLALAEALHSQFDAFSPSGQEQAVLLLTRLLQQDGPKPLPPRLTMAVSEILFKATKSNELRPAVLLLAAELVDCVQPGQWADVCRDLAEQGMKDEREATRVAAIQLLLRAPMRKDKELLEKAIPLLRDRETTVRRAALVALASENDLVREETLLPLLHDADDQVQYLCAMALRKRGLTDDDLQMARLISDKDPAMRLRVLHYFHRLPELNHVEWLRQLSLDPSPAVRAAAVRAIGENPQVDLADRLREMAERDSSETVRQNAQYYSRQRAPRVALD